MAEAKKPEKIVEVEETYEDHLEEIIAIMMMTPQSNPARPDCQWGQPAMFWGGSGIGKSDHMHQAAAYAGVPCEVLFPGQRQPEEFSGVLTPNANVPEGVSIECLLPAVRRLNKLGEGLLFVDEATNAPPAVQGAMLGMLLDRLVGDTKLAPKIRILLAGNPPDISAGGYGFEPPTANRLAHFKLGPPSWESWNKWYMSEENQIKATRQYSEALVAASWPEVYPHVKGMITGFLQRKPDAMYQQPTARDSKGGFQWPSPRTWVKAGRCMATRVTLGLPDELDDIVVGGLVGHGLATEFATWRREANLPTPEQVIAGKWKPDPHRLDIIHAVVGSLVPYVGLKRDEDTKQKAAIEVWNLFDKLIDLNFADLLVESMKSLVNVYGLGITGKASDDVKKVAKRVIGRTGKTGIGNYLL